MAKRKSRAMTVYRTERIRRVSRRHSRGSLFGGGKLSAALMAGFGVSLYNAYMPPDGSAGPPVSFNQYLQRLMLYYTGYAPWNPAGQKWQFAQTRFGLLPIVTGALVHYLATATGINRGLARVMPAKIPVQI